jgi:hypothetical protein
MIRRVPSRVVPALFILVLSISAAAQKPVRMSWQTFAQDPKRVESFRAAVFAMKVANLADPASAAYRGSWSYWGNMHGYFGTQSPFGTIMDWVNFRKIDLNQWGTYFAGVTNDTPPDSIAKDVWAQCQHTSRTAGVTPYFFPWHRLYLLYFEKVLQKAANDPTLRLPYWDYTDPANVSMPAEFLNPTYTNASGEVVANPLFEVRRMPGWLGAPYSTLDPDVTNIDKALGIPQLLDTVDADGNTIAGYQSTIEQSPHGDVHCAVMDCPTPVMGAVPYSSNDPIFWLHHTNIDRLWQCWESIPGHADPTDAAFLQKSFSYVDENGNEVTKTVNDIINGGMVDYVYEKPGDCERPKAVLAAAAPKMTAKQKETARKAVARPVTVGSAKGVVIDEATERATISLVGAGPKAQARDLALQKTDLPLKTELVLRGIHYKQHPGLIFKVYLERKDDPTNRRLAGTFSFFMPLDGADHEHHEGSSRLDRIFDVTEEVRALGGDHPQELNVAFEAATGRVGRERVRFHPEAGLEIDSVELRVRLEEPPKQK